MSTLNGFGTLYYGWRHADDGTATATKWLALSWLPVIPIGRVRLRVLSDFGDSTQTVKADLGGWTVSQTDHFQLLEKTPLSGKEIAITLAKAYIGLPAAFIGPVLVLMLVVAALHFLGIDVNPESSWFSLMYVGMGAAFIHFFYHVIRAVRRTRGWQPKVQ